MESAVGATVSESDFAELIARAEQHWQLSANEQTFAAQDGVRINFARLDVDNPKALVVVANGRTESYLKYKDLALELNEQRYSVILYDHRGQGLSGRLLNDPRKGYVQSFSDYVHDLKALVDQEVATEKSGIKKILLSHSMGGTVSALYAQAYPEDFDGFIMTSPMLGLPAGAAGRWLSTAVDAGEAVLQRLFDREPGYIPGIGQYSDIPFEENGITHSLERYRHIGTLVREHPQIALGDPTTHWVHESYRAFDALFAGADKIIRPVLLLQAGDDRIISNEAQREFCKAIGPHCVSGAPRVVDGAKHELLNEADEYRNQAIEHIMKFLHELTST